MWKAERKCGCTLGADIPDPSRILAIADPLFLLFNASMQFHPVISPGHLAKAGLDDLGENYE
jgi:hypothetical protein